ncbi:MAG: WbqC family protein [Nanoarchaeota archaeon]|nr:WbqC family protein [Nanoarchaeota archaeon]
MILAAHQPNFLPNIGFFQKIQEADFFVIPIGMQFEKGEGWQQRNKFPFGWFTVPVLGGQNQIIQDVKINNDVGWKEKYLRTLKYHYQNYPNFREYYEPLEKIFSMEWKYLSDLNIHLIQWLGFVLKIDTPIIIGLMEQGMKTEKIINLCKRYKCDTYISGEGAYKNYLDIKKVEESGIVSVINKFDYAKYPYSVLHYLITEGIAWTKAVLNKHSQKE